MANLQKAIIFAYWGNAGKLFEVQHNPTELSLDKGTQLAEIAIPGLDAPLQQFVRGQAEKLSVELFFDTTEGGTGAQAKSVTELTDEIYMLSKIESNSHAPPLVDFLWGFHFPGDSLAEAMSANSFGGPATNQTRYSFSGVVESIKQKYTLFSPDGIPLRATINLVLREYRSLDLQLYQLGLNSPDRTHSHVLATGDTLSSVANDIYARPSEWRRVANENNITDPRRINPGTFIKVPAITN